MGVSKKKFLAVTNSFFEALSSPITIFLRYLILLISEIIFGRAFPSSSEYKDGRIKVIGLNFENSKSSFSRSSLALLEKLCRVATIPF